MNRTYSFEDVEADLEAAAAHDPGVRPLVNSFASARAAARPGMWKTYRVIQAMRLSMNPVLSEADFRRKLASEMGANSEPFRLYIAQAAAEAAVRKLWGHLPESRT